MKIACAMFILSSLLVGCQREGEWKQKYADCQMLAAVMAGQPDGIMKPPDCERIPKLCSADPDSPGCTAELQRYRRK